MTWLEQLVQHAQENLSGDRELEALWSRGVSDEQVQEFQLGYLENGFPKLDYPKEFSAWFSFNKSRLVDILVIPLTNSLGQIRGLQFRSICRDVKGYLDYIPLNDEPIFFGLGQAMPHIWKSDTICLVEGVFDHLPVQRIFPNTVPTLTSSVSTTFFRFLKRNVKNIWFLYDMDHAGIKGVLEFLSNYKTEFDSILHPQIPRVKTLSGKYCKDPGELWESLGDSKLRDLLVPAFGLV